MTYELFLNGGKILGSGKLFDIMWEVWNLMSLDVIVGYSLTEEEVQKELDKNGSYSEDNFEIIKK